MGDRAGAQTPPDGWYPDPTGRHKKRYWEGERWTDSVLDKGLGKDSILNECPPPPSPPAPVTQAKPTRRTGVVLAGVLLLLGLVAGVIGLVAAGSSDDLEPDRPTAPARATGIDDGDAASNSNDVGLDLTAQDALDIACMNWRATYQAHERGDLLPGDDLLAMLVTAGAFDEAARLDRQYRQTASWAESVVDYLRVTDLPTAVREADFDTRLGSIQESCELTWDRQERGDLPEPLYPLLDDAAD